MCEFIRIQDQQNKYKYKISFQVMLQYFLKFWFWFFFLRIIISFLIFYKIVTFKQIIYLFIINWYSQFKITRSNNYTTLLFNLKLKSIPTFTLKE